MHHIPTLIIGRPWFTATFEVEEEENVNRLTLLMSINHYPQNYLIIIARDDVVEK